MSLRFPSSAFDVGFDVYAMRETVGRPLRIAHLKTRR